ncbi:hypothetical protein DINM_001553 [Dirofilaria immitis]|nr:hypothetical protein [Dirofilaria immitis]
MPHGKLLNRPINVLYPLEINDSLDNQPPISEESIQEVEQEKPIASRTRSAINKLTIAETICKSNWTMSSLVLISTIFILSVQAKTMKECEWKVGIPFNIPQRFSLSVISDQTVTSATSSHFCRNLDRQKEIDGEEMGKSCPYRKIGEFDAQLSGSHVIIDKLQTSFIFKENGIILNSNCNFSEPYLMNGNIIIDKGTNNLANNLRKQSSDPEGELIMKEVNKGEELVNQLETQFDETTESIEQELSEVMKRWKLITFSIIVFAILIMIIVIKLKFELIRSPYHFFCIRTTNRGVDNSMELVRVPTPKIGDQEPPNTIQ